MTDYLDQLFSDNKGYVSVAYKRGATGWGEQHFAWPSERPKLEIWATKHVNDDVFICPALRMHKRRTKGDGKALEWLWADVDMEKIPTRRHDVIRKRIKKLGTIIVSSGTGDNAHVYVRLTHEVTAAEHEVLNTGLRDYLAADNKQADNSLLRLPGTRNHKPGNNGAVVARRAGNSRRVDPDKLMELTAWRTVKIEGGTRSAGDWDLVDVAHLVKGSLKALLGMTDDEAKGRFGSRYKAISFVTAKLIKRGFTVDQVHSLMDQFAPAVSKAADEHGAYDVHKDVAKIIARQPTREVVTPEVEASADGPDGPPVHEDVEAELRRRAIRREADQHEAQRTFRAPPADVTGSLYDDLRAPTRTTPYLIDGIAGARHNVLITAQFKTGKTLFSMNLARSLVEGTPFLDEFTTHMPAQGLVHIWSCEMDRQELIDDYLRPQQISNRGSKRMQVSHLRGYKISLITDVGKAWAINNLQGTKVWIIDSLARLARMAGIDENDNPGMLDLFAAIDEIKQAAGIDACFVIAHTGRTEMAEGTERARGATAIDDWPDARWILIRENRIRLLSVDGRGVTLGQTSVHFDEHTKKLSLGMAGNRQSVRAGADVEAVVQCVHDAIESLPGSEKDRRVKQTELMRIAKERGIAGSNRSRTLELIREAVEMGRIIEETSFPGASRKQGVYYAMPGGATRVLDFTDVDKPRRRKKRNAKADA